MIQIKNLSVSYNSKEKILHALGPINLQIDKGEIVTIIGPSGCGKSTLLQVLSGIIKNHEGEVLLNGEELSPHNHKISFIPQNFGLLPWKTVKENCLLSFKITKTKLSKEKEKEINNIYQKLNIWSLLDRYPSQLSGGQKQRVALARTLMMVPDLILMDEPFSALDAIISEEAQELFLKIWIENKKSTFIVTHNIHEALYLGQKIVILSNHPGQIEDIIINPFFNNKESLNKEDYTELYSKIKNYIKKGWEN